MYGRWFQFAYDMRSDIGYSQSPWGDLANFTKSVLGSYDFEVNREIWVHNYQAVFRANQVVNNVPNIQQMNAGTRDRIVAEAKFIRALAYFNLVNLYGNIPLILETPEPATRPAQVTPEQAWAQIEKDLQEARTALPVSAADPGRATRGAATGLLGRAHLQQREWNDAAARFAEVVGSGQYQLLPNYRDNFTESGNNSRETVFEVQFGGPEVLSAGSRGQNIIKLLGPCSPSGPNFCDGDVRPWYFDLFMQEMTTAGAVDPRLDATLFYRGTAYGKPYSQYFGADNGRKFWIKYGEYYKGDQDWDNPINVKVMRLGGILLLQAEALNEAGQTAQAAAAVNQVRARAGLAPLPTGLSQAQLRTRIEQEQLKELGFENERWLYLARQGLLTNAGGIAALRARDADFANFAPHQALLPIPTTEINLNGNNVKQNPGW
jgi:hypothetical protein